MARLYINLAKIEDNSRLVSRLLEPLGIRLIGVTKACLGNELIGGAMLAGGAAGLADSRIESIANLRRHFPETELSLLRPPPDGRRRLAEAVAAREPAETLYVSSVANLESLGISGSDSVSICLMIDCGEGREGLPPALAADEALRAVSIPGVRLMGLAANAACGRGNFRLAECLTTFYQTSARILWRLSAEMLSRRGAPESSGSSGQNHPAAILPSGKLPSFKVMSLGGSGFLSLVSGAAADTAGSSLEPGQNPGLGALSELRCGEALLLGRIPTGDSSDLFIRGGYRDAFVLEGTVLESFEKNGERQLLLDFGLQDTAGATVVPCRAGINLLCSSSDYTTVAVRSGGAVSEDQRPGEPRVGERLSFLPTYHALLAAMTSPFVEKAFLRHN